MVVHQGEKLHVIVRRNFEGDLRRHFVGEVIDATETLARIEGYTFVLNTGTNQYQKRPDRRIRIVGLGDAGNIINVLPVEADLDAIKYMVTPDKRLVVTDENTFSLDVNEFGSAQ